MNSRSDGHAVLYFYALLCLVQHTDVQVFDKHFQPAKTFLLLEEAILPWPELPMALPWLCPTWCQYTYLGSHRVNWRNDLAEKQLYWHKQSPSTCRTGDMHLGWAEGERQQWQLKTFVQLEVKRSGSNMGSSSAAIITGLLESPFLLLRVIIRQLQVGDIFSLLSEPLHWIRKYRINISCARGAKFGLGLSQISGVPESQMLI